MRHLLIASTVSIAALSSLAAAATDQETGAAGGGKSDRQRPVAAWATRCSEAASQKERTCVLSKALIDPASRKLMVAVTFRVAPPDRKPVMKLLLPVGLYLPAGVTMAVDDGAPKTLKFETCVGNGCLAPVPLDAAFLQRLRKASGIKVGYQTVDQKPVDVTLRLDGFAKSFDQIK